MGGGGRIKMFGSITDEERKDVLVNTSTHAWTYTRDVEEKENKGIHGTARYRQTLHF